MGTELKKALTWEIENFSERNDLITSNPFSSSDGCKWYIRVYPKGYHGSDHLSVFLRVANDKSLRPGWKRIASSRIVLLNQSGKELYRSTDHKCSSNLYCSEIVSRGIKKTLPLSKLQEKGFLEKNKLIIEVYIKVLEAVDQGISTENEMLNFNGFKIVASQAFSVGMIFEQHPDFAVDFKPKNQGVKKAYMNLLLGLIETLSKSPKSFSVTELSNAQKELTELTEAGFKLDWLKTRLEVVSLEKKKSVSDGSLVLELEERVKNMELTLSDLKVELDKERMKSASAAAARVYSFEFIDFFIKRFFLSCFSISKY